MWCNQPIACPYPLDHSNVFVQYALIGNNPFSDNTYPHQFVHEEIQVFSDITRYALPVQRRSHSFICSDKLTRYLYTGYRLSYKSNSLHFIKSFWTSTVVSTVGDSNLTRISFSEKQVLLTDKQKWMGKGAYDYPCTVSAEHIPPTDRFLAAPYALALSMNDPDGSDIPLHEATDNNCTHFGIEYEPERNPFQVLDRVPAAGWSVALLSTYLEASDRWPGPALANKDQAFPNPDDDKKRIQ